MATMPTRAPNPERLADILPRVLPVILGRRVYDLLFRDAE